MYVYIDIVGLSILCILKVLPGRERIGGDGNPAIHSAPVSSRNNNICTCTGCLENIARFGG